MIVAGTALLTDANRNVFENHEASLVPQRLAIDDPLANHSTTVLATEIVHVRTYAAHDYCPAIDPLLRILCSTRGGDIGSCLIRTPTAR